jgi:hypothetical protein
MTLQQPSSTTYQDTNGLNTRKAISHRQTRFFTSPGFFNQPKNPFNPIVQVDPYDFGVTIFADKLIKKFYSERNTLFSLDKFDFCSENGVEVCMITKSPNIPQSIDFFSGDIKFLDLRIYLKDFLDKDKDAKDFFWWLIDNSCARIYT